MMKKGLLAIIIAVTLSLGNAAAQEEYRMEAGPALGTSFYMGDTNLRLYRNSSISGGVMVRYNFNPRLALKADLLAVHIDGSTDDIKDRTFPESHSFCRTVYDLGVQIECGFWGYGMTSYNGSHRLAPYYFVGAGFTFAPKPTDNIYTLNIPLGIGIRYKLTERINIGLEWAMRFSGSDKLDVTEKSATGGSLEDPYQIKGKGFKNKDSYCTTLISVTYDIFQKPCDCN